MNSPTLSLRPMPPEWAELLQLDPLRASARNVPTSLKLADIIVARRVTRALQQLVGPPFVVRYEPDALLCNGDDEDLAAMGHLYSISIDPQQAESLTCGTLDDREADLPGQVHAWLLRSAAVFLKAAERIAATP